MKQTTADFGVILNDAPSPHWFPVIELLKEHYGDDYGDRISKIHTLDDIFNLGCFQFYWYEFDGMLEAYRKAALMELRQARLLDINIGTLSNQFVFDDDGIKIWEQANCKIVDLLLDAIIEKSIEDRRYGDYGGGGDIYWDIDTDKIIISAYRNVLAQEDILVDIEVR